MLRHGDVELNRMERRVVRNGQGVDLTAKEFSLLEYLMQRSGRCCSRAELLREVWQMSPDADTNVVDVYINYLRKKLGAAATEGADYSVIMTVRGEGYKMGGKKPLVRADYAMSAVLAGA
jgi:DNA-binding response OmpR family regulator